MTTGTHWTPPPTAVLFTANISQSECLRQALRVSSDETTAYLLMYHSFYDAINVTDYIQSTDGKMGNW
jgi:hypothetical protein